MQHAQLHISSRMQCFCIPKGFEDSFLFEKHIFLAISWKLSVAMSVCLSLSLKNILIISEWIVSENVKQLNLVYEKNVREVLNFSKGSAQHCCIITTSISCVSNTYWTRHILVLWESNECKRHIKPTAKWLTSDL